LEPVKKFGPKVGCCWKVAGKAVVKTGRGGTVVWVPRFVPKLKAPLFVSVPKSKAPLVLTGWKAPKVVRGASVGDPKSKELGMRVGVVRGALLVKVKPPGPNVCTVDTPSPVLMTTVRVVVVAAVVVVVVVTGTRAVTALAPEEGRRLRD